MTQQVAEYLKGNISGVNPEVAAGNLAKLLGFLPDWAQATVLNEELKLRDTEVQVAKRLKGFFSPKTKRGPAMLNAPLSSMDMSQAADRASVFGQTLHEVAHAVDHQQEVLGRAFENTAYHGFSKEFLKKDRGTLNADEKVIHWHASQPVYKNAYKALEQDGVSAEIHQTIAPAHEIQAETGRHYFDAYSRHQGDAVKIEAELSQKLPNLWPAFRDHLIPEYKAKTQEKVSALRKAGLITGDAEAARTVVETTTDKMQSWLERIGPRRAMIGAGVAALAAGAGWVALNHHKKQAASDDKGPTP